MKKYKKHYKKARTIFKKTQALNKKQKIKIITKPYKQLKNDIQNK